MGPLWIYNISLEKLQVKLTSPPANAFQRPLHFFWGPTKNKTRKPRESSVKTAVSKNHRCFGSGAISRGAEVEFGESPKLGEVRSGPDQLF